MANGQNMDAVGQDAIDDPIAALVDLPDIVTLVLLDNATS